MKPDFQTRHCSTLRDTMRGLFGVFACALVGGWCAGQASEVAVAEASPSAPTALAPAPSFKSTGVKQPAEQAKLFSEDSAQSTGRAFVAAKLLTAELEGPGFLNHGVVLVRNGVIEAVGRKGEVNIPDGYEVVDCGERWIMPGMVDLHCHVAGSRDINDMVYQANPGLRVTGSVIPGAASLRRGLGAGVTTVLFIPGSGTNIGGQGVLLKTGFNSYEEMLVRDPGSLKIAQGDNPTRWGYGMGRSMMNFTIRSVLRRGQAYHQRWVAAKDRLGEPERRDPQLDVFLSLFGHESQISTHTQYYQLVLTSITLMAGEFGLDVFIDHGTFDGYRTSELAQEHKVAAIIGPRQISRDSSRYPNDLAGSVVGCAGEYQKRGHKLVGFNTDAPVVPQEELSLQSAVAVRYGFDNSEMGAVRGLTIVPAVVAGIEDRVGSLEVGKEADLVIVTGDPSDPRSAVDQVYIEGRLVYSVDQTGLSRDGLARRGF